MNPYSAVLLEHAHKLRAMATEIDNLSSDIIRDEQQQIKKGVEVEEELNDLEWWAYLHINNAIIVKRHYDMEDIREASRSDFVKTTVGPYRARNKRMAENIAYGALAGNFAS